MSFFKNLFSPNRKENGEPKRRIWPVRYLGQEALNSPEAYLDKGFVYSGVYELKGDLQNYFSRRYIYIGARHHGKRFGMDEWTVSYYCFDDGDQNTLKEQGRLENVRSASVLDKILEFEKWMTSRGCKQVTGTTENYRLFASLQGKYFTNDNKVVEVDPAKLLTVPIVLPRNISDRFYSVSGVYDAPMATWEGFYARYVDGIEKVMPAETIDETRRMGFYPWLMDDTIQSFDGLKHVLQTSATNHLLLKGAILSAGSFRIKTSDYKQLALVAHLTQVSKIISLLRIGANFMDSLPDTIDGAVNMRKIEALKDVRDHVDAALIKYLDLKPEERRQICDIMLKGPDPRGSDLPIEIFYKANPALPKEDLPPQQPAADVPALEQGQTTKTAAVGKPKPQKPRKTGKSIK